MPPQPSTVRTGPLGQAGGALSSAAEGFIVADALNEQKKARDEKGLESVVEAILSGDTETGLEIANSLGARGESFIAHLSARTQKPIALDDPDFEELLAKRAALPPLDAVTGAALTKVVSFQKTKNIELEELIAGVQAPGKGPSKQPAGIQKDIQTERGRRELRSEIAATPGSPFAKVATRKLQERKTEFEESVARKTEERKVEGEARAARAETFGQRLAEIDERRLQGAAALAAQREKRLTIAQNNMLRMAIADQRSAQSLARLKLTKDRVDDQKAFFSQIADDADANKKLNNAQVSAGIIPTINASASAVRQELNRIAFTNRLKGTQAGVLARPVSQVEESIRQGALTPELRRAITAEFPQNSQAAIRAFNKTIESVRATEFSRKALGNKDALQRISAVLSAVKGRPASEREAEIDRVLELLAAATGLPVNTLSADSGKGKSVKQFVNDFVGSAGLAGVPIGGLPALISGISNILFDGQTTTAPAPRAPAAARPSSQVQQDEADFLDF